MSEEPVWWLLNGRRHSDSWGLLIVGLPHCRMYSFHIWTTTICHHPNYLVSFGTELPFTATHSMVVTFLKDPLVALRRPGANIFLLASLWGLDIFFRMFQKITWSATPTCPAVFPCPLGKVALRLDSPWPLVIFPVAACHALPLAFSLPALLWDLPHCLHHTAKASMDGIQSAWSPGPLPTSWLKRSKWSSRTPEEAGSPRAPQVLAGAAGCSHWGTRAPSLASHHTQCPHPAFFSLERKAERPTQGLP